MTTARAAAAARPPQRPTLAGTCRARSRIDGSSTVGPVRRRRRRSCSTRRTPTCRSRSASPAPAAASRSSAPARPTSRDASRPIKDDEEVAGLREGRRQVRRGPDRQRRHRRRDQQGPRRRLPDHRTSSRRSGTRARRSRTLSEVDPKLPDTELSLYGPGTDSGTFDFFTDEINGEEGVQPRGLRGLRGRQPARHGRLRRRGRPGLLRLLLLRGRRGQAQPRRRRQRRRQLRQAVEPRRSRTAPTSRSRVRCSCTRAQKAIERPEVKAFMEFVVAQAPADRRGGQDRAAHRRADHRPPRTSSPTPRRTLS